MVEEIKVSVIMPVYNAERYLVQCLDSVVSQTLKEIEIICVDDGSDDNSVQIIKDYCSKDDRISLMHQDHSHAGPARNRGMSVARGKYLVFWDSDDYFFPNALKFMYEQCEKDNADICICGGKRYFEAEELETPSPRYLRKNEIPEEIPFNIKTAPDHVISITVEAPWNKMFLKSFIEETGLQFHPCRNGNDIFFVISALCLAQRITLVNKPLVCYRFIRKESLNSTISEGLKGAINEWLYTASFLKEHEAFPKRSFANKCFESVLHLLNNTENWPVFRENYLMLQNGYLEKLGITCSEDDSYYYMKYHNDAVKNMYRLTPEEFSRYIGRVFFLKESEAVAKARKNKEDSKATTKKLNKEIESINIKLVQIKEENKLIKEENDYAKKEIEKKNNEINELKKSINNKNEELLTLKKNVDSKKHEIKAIKESVSYKVGRKLTWVPRHIRDIAKKSK